MELPFKSIPSLFESVARAHPNKVYMQIKGDEGYIAYTYSQAYSIVKSLAHSLSSYAKKGDHIALLSENMPEWCIAYLAASSLGCIVVPLDTNLNEENLILFLEHSDSKIIFVSGQFTNKINSIKPKLRKLKQILPIDFKPIANKEAEFDITNNADLDDVASLIYTSGTSGQPKGVMLTHSSLLHDVVLGSKRFDLSSKDTFILLLPLYHIFAFTTIFLTSTYFGASITFVRTLKREEILGTIKEAKITTVFAVPQLFESIYNGIMERIEEQPAYTRMLLDFSKFANQASISLFRKNIGKLFFSQIHEKIGNTLRLMVSGGAAIKKDVLIGMYLLGFPIIEGYGLTETSPVVAVNSLNNVKYGSVGRPLKGVEVKIESPNENGIGEIIVKGPTVMKGYYKNEKLTKEALNDGWLHTQDLGRIDEGGFLYIKGRKDNVIILHSGKNVYPEDVEHHYLKSSLIEEICVIGLTHENASHETVHAIVVPSLKEIQKRGLTNIEGAVKEEIGEYSRMLPSYKRILSFDIAEPNSLPKTSTLKFKKHEIKKGIQRGIIRAAQSAKIDNGKAGDFIIDLLKSHSKKQNFDENSSLELDLHLDSLGVVEIASKIEQKLGVKIDYNSLELRTVGDILRLANSHSGKIQGGNSGNSFDDRSFEGIPLRADYSENAMNERLQWMNKKFSLELKHIKGGKTNAELLKGNIEHFIGMSQIPTGIAGPLKVNGANAKGQFYVPLATTEGALVASVNRGMNILTKSNGANAKVISEQMTKAPMFILRNAEGAIRLGNWVDLNFLKIKKEAESATKHGKLARIEKFLLGRRLVLKMCYTCGDAMGANMITMMTQKACEFINSHNGIESYMLQCNLEGEKKVSYMNFFSGRGKQVYADAAIPKELVEKYLHTTVDKIMFTAQNSNLGSMMSGMVGTNAHIANIITAVFIATGQDVAHVHDSSVGITTFDKTNEGDLYVSVNLPCLAIGTIGGGTGLGTQKECLEIMGCSGSGKANKLAEIIAASVLAGELSLAGSHAAGDFAFAHDKFGRNRPESKGKLNL